MPLPGDAEAQRAEATRGRPEPRRARELLSTAPAHGALAAGAPAPHRHLSLGVQKDNRAFKTDFYKLGV